MIKYYQVVIQKYNGTLVSNSQDSHLLSNVIQSSEDFLDRMDRFVNQFYLDLPTYANPKTEHDYEEVEKFETEACTCLLLVHKQAGEQLKLLTDLWIGRPAVA